MPKFLMFNAFTLLSRVRTIYARYWCNKFCLKPGGVKMDKYRVWRRGVDKEEKCSGSSVAFPHYQIGHFGGSREQTLQGPFCCLHNYCKWSHMELGINEILKMMRAETFVMK